MSKIKDIINKKVLPPVTYDRSTLEQYSNCPYMANAIQSGKIKDINELAEVGTEAHRIIEEAIQAVGESYNDMWDYIENELPKARPDIQPQVIACLSKMKQRIERIDPVRIIGCEKQFSTEFIKATDTNGAIILTCAIDLLTAARDSDTVIITDWKTGWKKRTNSDAYNAFQTCFLSWVVWRELPSIQRIHFFYEQTRYDNSAYALLERERDFYNFEGRIQEALRFILMDSKDAWPNSDKCCWCPATAICPHVIGEAKDLNADPQGYLKQYIALDCGRVSVMKKALDSYCKTHGRIDLPDGQFYGYVPAKPKITFKVHKAGKLNKAENGEDEIE